MRSAVLCTRCGSHRSWGSRSGSRSSSASSPGSRHISSSIPLRSSRGLPGRPGCIASRKVCTSRPGSRRSPCCWRSCGRSTPGSGPTPPSGRSRTRSSGLARAPRRWVALPVVHRDGVDLPVVPVALLVPARSLRGRVDHDRCAHRPHRREGRAARLALSSRSAEGGVDAIAAERAWGGLSRRGFLGPSSPRPAASSSRPSGRRCVRWPASPCSAPRDPRVGPQGVPVNRTAAKAGVVDAATDPSYRLAVDGNVESADVAVDRRPPGDEMARGRPGDRLRRRVELRPRVGAVSHSGTCSLRPVLSPTHRVAWCPAGALRVRNGRGQRRRTSPIRTRSWHSSSTGNHCISTTASPCGSIGPNRPGVLQTKWVASVVVA